MASGGVGGAEPPRPRAERDRFLNLRGLVMGVNRIVMHNGVVWWLPPLRPKTDSAAAEAPADGTPPPRRKRPDPKGRPRRSTGPGAVPPAGFIPLASLGIPGIDSILDSHADFYRDAYDRAVRDQRRRGQPGADADGSPRDEDFPGDPGRAAS